MGHFTGFNVTCKLVHNIAPPLSSCCASIYILSATAAALPQPVCRFVSRVVRKCKVKKKQGRKRCARAKTEVLLFEHRTRLSMLGGDPLDKCTLPVGECYVLTLLTKCYFSNAKQARSEWECARFIYPRYELLYELVVGSKRLQPPARRLCTNKLPTSTNRQV